jgi:hypothetical protein
MTSADFPPRPTFLSRWLFRIATVVAALVACVVAPLIGTAPAASALPVTARGLGYFSPDGGGFWLGSWRLADGTMAFCVNTERSTPNGQDYTYADGAALGWYDADDSARLAYVARTWAGTTDPLVAAAGQIATWTITGLGRHTQEELAAKAGPNAGAVRELARKMLEETEKSASLSVTATLHFGRDPDGTATITPSLLVSTLSTGEVHIPAGSHRGTITLSGATFADGSTSATVRNDEALVVHVPDEKALAGVTATTRFEALPYGNGLRMAVAQAGAQNLLTSQPSPATATADLSTTLPSARPFQPLVSTRSSAATAEAGDSLYDTVVVGVRATPTTVSEWPVFGPPGGPFVPVPVTVRSRLLGPFEERIELAPEPPAGAPVVCEVSMVVTTGPGEYRTPACNLPGPGHYVWVETISPADTASAEGGARIQPWASPFGVATEITTVAAPPAPPAAETSPVARLLPETGQTAGGSSPVVAVALALVVAGMGCLARCRHGDDVRT